MECLELSVFTENKLLIACEEEWVRMSWNGAGKIKEGGI
jgi:hypothetical protein